MSEGDINRDFLHDLINKLMAMQGKIKKIKKQELSQISEDISKLEVLAQSTLELVEDFKSFNID